MSGKDQGNICPVCGSETYEFQPTLFPGLFRCTDGNCPWVADRPRKDLALPPTTDTARKRIKYADMSDKEIGWYQDGTEMINDYLRAKGRL